MPAKLTPIDPQIALLEPVDFGKNQPQYFPPPACRTEEGDVVSCWKPNVLARLAVLFGANSYLTMVTFNEPLMPVRVSVVKPVYERVRGD